MLKRTQMACILLGVTIASFAVQGLAASDVLDELSRGSDLSGRLLRQFTLDHPIVVALNGRRLWESQFWKFTLRNAVEGALEEEGRKRTLDLVESTDLAIFGASKIVPFGKSGDLGGFSAMLRGRYDTKQIIAQLKPMAKLSYRIGETQVLELEFEDTQFTNPLMPFHVGGKRTYLAAIDGKTLLVVSGDKTHLEELLKKAQSSTNMEPSRTLTLVKEHFPQWTIMVVSDRPRKAVSAEQQDFSLSDVEYCIGGIDVVTEFQFDFLAVARDLPTAVHFEENGKKAVAQFRQVLGGFALLDQTNVPIILELLEQLRFSRDGRKARVELHAPLGLVLMGFDNKPLRYLDGSGKKVDVRSKAKWLEVCYVVPGSIRVSARLDLEAEEALEYYTLDGKRAVAAAGFWRQLRTIRKRIGEHDAPWCEASMAFFDLKGEPVECSDGYYKMSEVRDKEGKRIDCEYFDAGGRHCAVQTIVESVLNGSQGQSLGLKTGDILEKYRGAQIKSASHFIALHDEQSGDSEELMVKRGDRTLSFAVKREKLGAYLKDVGASSKK
jgi:hypothetical protein